jgi:hypothetical protein
MVGSDEPGRCNEGKKPMVIAPPRTRTVEVDDIDLDVSILELDDDKIPKGFLTVPCTTPAHCGGTKSCTDPPCQTIGCH